MLLLRSSNLFLSSKNAKNTLLLKLSIYSLQFTFFSGACLVRLDLFVKLFFKLAKGSLLLILHSELALHLVLVTRFDHGA